MSYYITSNYAIPFHTGEEAPKTSPEVLNKGVGGPTKRTDVLKQFKKDKKLCDYFNQNLRSDSCFAIQRNKNQTEK